MKKSCIIIILVLIIMFSTVYSKNAEKCGEEEILEGINDILESRWPYESGASYYRIYRYPVSTKNIEEYEDNKEFIKWDETNFQRTGAYLSETDKWEAGETIWLPKPEWKQGYYMYRDEYDLLPDLNRLSDYQAMT